MPGNIVFLQFSRTVAPTTMRAPTLIGLMVHTRWKKTAVLTSSDRVYFLAGLGITSQLRDASIEVLKPTAFDPGSTKDATAALLEIKRSGIRIVVVMAYAADTQAVAHKAYREDMARVGWAWLLAESDTMTEHMQGWLFLQSLLPSEGMQGFAEQVSKYTRSGFNITVPADSVNQEYSLALYSAIMLYAHAATKVLLEGGELDDGQSVTAALRNTTFVGVGGQEVFLNEHGDRIESYEVMNYVMLEDGATRSLPVGRYNSTTRKYLAYGRAVVWPGHTTVVPNDSAGLLQHCLIQCDLIALLCTT